MDWRQLRSLSRKRNSLTKSAPGPYERIIEVVGLKNTITESADQEIVP